MKTKDQQLKEAYADKEKAYADWKKAEADYRKSIEKAVADWDKAYDRIQELEKQWKH